MADKPAPEEMESGALKAAPEMPDLAAREPAEGDLDQIGVTDHLCCPDEAPSSGLPVEAGAFGDRSTPQ